MMKRESRREREANEIEIKRQEMGEITRINHSVHQQLDALYT